MSEQTTYDHMRRAAEWLEQNGVDWVTYDLQSRVMSFGYVDAESDRLRRIKELCKGMTATVTHSSQASTYTIDANGEQFGFRWNVWQRPAVAEADKVVIE